jgi:hypothetical protein
VDGFGRMVGGVTGMEGRTSFASAGGLMRVAGVPTLGDGAAEVGAARAASRDETGEGELLFPV